MFASFHMVLSVSSLGELISTIDTLREERRSTLRRVKQLTARFDHALLGKLIERAKELRPKVQRDGEGLTELEFVLAHVRIKVHRGADVVFLHSPAWYSWLGAWDGGLACWWAATTGWLL